MEPVPDNRLSWLALDFLSELERAEAELICWGFTGGALGGDELQRLAESFLIARGIDEFEPGQLLAALRDRKLLFDFAGGARTRMGETMRLLARLKLLVPKRMEKRAWMASPDLVNDFRLSIEPRARPRRDLEPADSISVNSETVKALTRRLKLSGFQVRATERLLETAKGDEATGTIICAGTGSGKTLAFYLPALTAISDNIDGTYWTKVLAIYPRTELLKDQLLEAVKAAQSLSSELTRRRGGRLLRIGAIYGDAPNSIRQLRWRKGKVGRICPYLRCPGCNGELIWPEIEIQAGRESLHCQTCAEPLWGVDLGLTRGELVRRPPDILFVTSEILNQRMSDSQLGRLVGIDVKPEKSPRFVLLDEVHTYTGVAGAQFALLLRRWLRRSGARPSFVGLSATLMEPARFFSELTGIAPDLVAEIGPVEDELEYEGAEYLLALRGNPVSSASLLSTTIQTSMLLGRMLDKLGKSVSGHVCGGKTFLFTDDLDVTNRMLYDLRDSEGRNPSTSNLVQGRIPLAALRALDRPDRDTREAHGQLWAVAEQLGHTLSGEDPAALRIDRVSSQDPGLNADSEVVVATASLEVGYNDLDAGAIIQHKAPRDAAVFLQRKGRAGRRSVCRPWTVVVLSDWGRDRQAFQGFDVLFSPRLRPRELPFRNRYVRKMQAAYALIDWLGLSLAEGGGSPDGSVWLDFCGPAKDSTQERRQQLLAGFLRELLTSEARQSAFSAYLVESLRLDPDEVESLLWESPRAILNAAVPTAIRRLETQWAFRGEPGKDLQAPNSPLPEFVTANLFSELATPEVVIRLPDYLGKPRSPQRMPVLQAIREFAPGRVTRRFSVESGSERHWIPVDHDDEPESDFPIDRLVSEEHRDVLGTFELSDGQTRFEAECARPHCFEPSLAAKSIPDSCNATLVWSSELVMPPAGGLSIDEIPQSWQGLVRDANFFLHARQSPMEIRRFAHAARVSFRDDGGANRRKLIRFVSSGRTRKRRAIGFILDVDSLKLRLTIPRLSAGASRFQSVMPALRAARFRDGILNTPVLDGLANHFQRQWIAQTALGAIVLTAQANGEDLRGAGARLLSGDLASALRKVMRFAFQVGESSQQRGNRSVREIFGVFASPQTRQAIAEQLLVLWEEPDLDWDRWFALRVGSVFGETLKGAVETLLPQTEASDVIVDLELADSAGAPGVLELDLWLSERSIGGGGVVEKLAGLVRSSAGSVDEAFRASLAPSAREVCSIELSRFLTSLLDPDSRLAEIVGEYRSANSHGARVAAFRQLREALPEVGVAASHPVVSAIGHRILRPGSSAATDAFAARLDQFWTECESKWGAELDARALACLAVRDPAISREIGELFGQEEPGRDEAWRFNVIYAQLWPRGASAAGSGEGGFNEFQPLPPADPRLLRAVLAQSDQAIKPAVDPLPPRTRKQSSNRPKLEILSQFFGSENELSARPGEGDWHGVFVRHAESQNEIFVLPRVLENESIWYAGCRDDRARRRLAEALWSFVGPSDTNFMRRESGPEDDDPVDAAFAELAGKRFFKFWVIPSGVERVRWALQQLLAQLSNSSTAECSGAATRIRLSPTL